MSKVNPLLISFMFSLAWILPFTTKSGENCGPYFSNILFHQRLPFTADIH